LRQKASSTNDGKLSLNPKKHTHVTHHTSVLITVFSRQETSCAQKQNIPRAVAAAAAAAAQRNQQEYQCVITLTPPKAA
jgi:hypothetical protein